MLIDIFKLTLIINNNNKNWFERNIKKITSFNENVMISKCIDFDF